MNEDYTYLDKFVSGKAESINEAKAVNVDPTKGEDPKVSILKKMKSDGTIKEIMDKYKVDADRIFFELAPRFRRAKKGPVNVWSLKIADISKQYQSKVPVDFDTGKSVQKPSELQKAVMKESEQLDENYTYLDKFVSGKAEPLDEQTKEMYVWGTGKSANQKGKDIVIYQDLERFEIGNNQKMKFLGKIKISDVTDIEGKKISNLAKHYDDFIVYKNQKYIPLGISNKFKHGEEWDY